MRHFYQHIDGWFSYEYIYKDVVAQAKDGSLFVEIGSFKGRSTAFMCVEIANSGKDIKFECIDPLELISHYAESAIDQPEVFTDYNVVKFHERLMPVKEYYTLQQLTSNEAVNLYKDGSIDFLLIDGDHSFEAVKNDVNIFIPKMKADGLIACDDAFDESVCRAISEGAELHGLIAEFNGTHGFIKIP